MVAVESLHESSVEAVSVVEVLEAVVELVTPEEEAPQKRWRWTPERKPKRKTRTKEDELREELAQLMSSVTEPEEDEKPQTLI